MSRSEINRRWKRCASAVSKLDRLLHPVCINHDVLYDVYARVAIAARQLQSNSTMKRAIPAYMSHRGFK